MKIALAADHAGFELKQKVKALLEGLKHEVLDLGVHDTTPSDYPDSAEAIAKALASKRAERAIIVCGSGVGVSVAANKFPGVRAALCHDHYSAHQGVEHDDMNALCLGARIIGVEPAMEIVRAFVDARFSNEERHLRRLNKVKAFETKNFRGE